MGHALFLTFAILHLNLYLALLEDSFICSLSNRYCNAHFQANDGKEVAKIKERFKV
jgi:hypothetical protein